MINGRLKAIAALKREPLGRKSWKCHEDVLKSGSLAECSACLKEIVKRLVSQEEFEASIELYELLAGICLLAKDYTKALRYLAQAVRRLHSL